MFGPELCLTYNSKIVPLLLGPPAATIGIIGLRGGIGKTVLATALGRISRMITSFIMRDRTKRRTQLPLPTI